MGHIIGNGESSSFWNDICLDEVPLHLRFRRLFDIHVDQNIFVAEMLRLGWGREMELKDETFWNVLLKQI